MKIFNFWKTTFSQYYLSIYWWFYIKYWWNQWFFEDLAFDDLFWPSLAFVALDDFLKQKLTFAGKNWAQLTCFQQSDVKLISKWDLAFWISVTWQSTTFVGQTGSYRIRQDQTESEKRQLGLFPFEIIKQNNQLTPVLVIWFLVTLDRMKRAETFKFFC